MAAEASVPPNGIIRDCRRCLKVSQSENMASINEGFQILKEMEKAKNALIRVLVVEHPRILSSWQAHVKEVDPGRLIIEMDGSGVAVASD